MEGISLRPYSPHTDDVDLTHQLVVCYREVFAEGPWHEWFRCTRCQKYWGVRDRSLLEGMGFSHCGLPLVEFWPEGQVLEDLYHEIVPGASCWLALDGPRVVGFCWGYRAASEDLDSKLGLVVSQRLTRQYGPVAKIAYQDEVGVLLSHRGRKIAKAMVARRLEDFLAQGLEVGVVRTRRSPEPSETYGWYRDKLGYEILVEYPNGDGRVILGRSLNGLRDLLS